jgi:alkylhydroperoxidase family enzyme
MFKIEIQPRLKEPGIRHVQNQRIKSIQPPYSESIQESFDVIMPSGIAPLNIFRAVGNNERVLSRMVNGALLDRGSISIEQRELVILRACAICKAEYEWGVHVAAFGGKAGFTAEQIADTCSELPNSQIWEPEQLLLIRMVDELNQTADISDNLWSAMSKHLSEAQLIEVIMVAGLYHAVSFIANGLRIKHEKHAPRFLKDQT